MAKEKVSSPPTATNNVDSPTVAPSPQMATTTAASTAGETVVLQIDYELAASKKNRQYTIADVSTVRLAIAEHIVEFLSYHKVPTYHGYEYARWCFGVLIIIAGTFSYAYKHEAMADNRPVYFVSSIVFFICTLAQFYISRYVEGPTTFFLSKPFPSPNNSNNTKASSSSSSSLSSLSSSSLSSPKEKESGGSKGKDAPSPFFVKAFTSRIPNAEEQSEEDLIEVERILAVREAWANLGAVGRLLAWLGLKKVEKPPPESALTLSEFEEKTETKTEDEEKKKEGNKEEAKKKDDDKATSTAETEESGSTEGEQKKFIATLTDPAKPSDYSRYVTLNAEGSKYSQPLQTYLGNRHIRLRIEMNESLPCFKLFADELTMSRTSGFWSAPTVVASVEKTLAFATFFDREGFIHPPAIKENTMALLKELGTTSSDSKKKR